MGAVKRAIFGSMGFVLLLMFIAYGTSTIFQTYEATFMSRSIVHTSYGFDFYKYVFDFPAYSQNLQQDWFAPMKEHFGNVEIWQRWTALFNWQPTSSEEWWKALLTALIIVVYVLRNIMNTIIFSLNITILYPFQFLHMILMVLLSLLGINITGDWWLGQIFTWIWQNLFIPYIP